MKDVRDLSLGTLIRLLSSLLLILFGAFMDEAAHQVPRVRLFFCKEAKLLSALVKTTRRVCG